ncbi:neuronal acetylcholine receptor subunit alpha-9-like [Glandiceps talaboti]
MYISKPTILKSTCRVFVKYFPFDVQACKMKFGSWTYTKLQLNLMNFSSQPVLDTFIKNEQWHLQLSQTKRHVKHYECCTEEFPDVTFYLCMRRKPLYYIYNLITPCILLTGLSFLGFFMPYNVGVVKANLSVTLILSLTVFLLLVAQMMPRTSMEIPLIGQFYLASMSLISASTAMNVAVLNVNVCNREVPRWVRVFVLKYLGYICLQNLSCVASNIKPPRRTKSDDDGGASSMLRLRPSPMVGERLMLAAQRDARTTTTGRRCVSLNKSLTTVRSFPDISDEEVDVRFGKMENYVEQIFKHLKTVQRKQDKKAALREEWVQVATILDKVLLFIFTIATVTTTLSLLLQNPGSDTDTLCRNRINGDLETYP